MKVFAGKQRLKKEIRNKDFIWVDFQEKCFVA